MNRIGTVGDFFWIAAIGAVVLYVFFAVLGAFSPAEVWVVTGIVAVLLVLTAIHFVHLRRELHRQGPNEARRKLNAMRERRGF